MLKVLSKEFTGYLNSLVAYIVLGVFLTSTGLLLWVFPDTSILDYGYADLFSLFSLVPYILLFLIPAITMRSFAEEQKAGTFEWLVTQPLTEWEIIAGKYFASLLLVVFALLPTIVYSVSVWQLGDPPGNLDTPGVIGSYIGLFFLSAAFCGVGTLTSALSRNQIVSFVLGVFLCYLLFAGFDAISTLNTWSGFGLFVQQIGMAYHYESLSRGLIDSRDVIYFTSLTGFFLLITKTALGARSW